MVRSIVVCAFLLLLAGCHSGPSEEIESTPRWVKTVVPRPAGAGDARLSGTVRARFETPIAFQVGGRIAERAVDAGQRVAAGELLFALDPRDFREQVAVARAELQTAEAELATAAAETRRNRELLEREFISAQAFERFELAENSARERVEAAAARLEQAENALGYARLEAPRAGVLIDVSGEPGQVIAAGSPVAVLAEDGPREIEVFLPERIGVPETGRVLRADGSALALVVREVAGAADPVSRTWAARYALRDDDAGLRLGSVVKVALDGAGSAANLFEVPVGAINERGHGPQIWLIEDGRARPVRIELVDINSETARIVGEIAPDARIIALGTHLLEAGMAVRERDPDHDSEPGPDPDPEPEPKPEPIPAADSSR